MEKSTSLTRSCEDKLRAVTEHLVHAGAVGLCGESVVTSVEEREESAVISGGDQVSYLQAGLSTIRCSHQAVYKSDARDKSSVETAETIRGLGSGRVST